MSGTACGDSLCHVLMYAHMPKRDIHTFFATKPAIRSQKLTIMTLHEFT